MTDIECMDRLDMKFPDKITEEQQKMFYAYIKKERENYVPDFEDVIHFALYIFDHFPEAREMWQDRCMYVLCDEFPEHTTSGGIVKIIDSTEPEPTGERNVHEQPDGSQACV